MTGVHARPATNSPIDLLHKLFATDLDMAAYEKFGIKLLILVGLIIAVAWGIETISVHALLERRSVPANALVVMPSSSAANDGDRLAHVDGCFACHGRRLTGHIVFRSWFGTRIIAPNLTRIAHQETDSQLASAIRFGLKHDGTSIVDMPSKQFIKSSDSDVAAIIAYLRTLPERPDATGETRWRFDGRVMLAMGLLPMEATTVNMQARGPSRTPTSPLALGRYITQSHCSACHGTDLSGETLEASPDLRVAIQHYSLPAFDHFFQTGEGQIGHGTKTMTKMIRNRFKYLTPTEVHAIYVYLKSDDPSA
jgi:mono/diheme cytochrome c family protein